MSLGEIYVKIFGHNAVEPRRFSPKLVQRKQYFARVAHSYSAHLLSDFDESSVTGIQMWRFCEYWYREV